MESEYAALLIVLAAVSFGGYQVGEWLVRWGGLPGGTPIILAVAPMLFFAALVARNWWQARKQEADWQAHQTKGE